MQFICIQTKGWFRSHGLGSLILGLFFGLGGAWGSETRAEETSGMPVSGPHRLRVLTTIAPIYSWAARVAGTNAQVENLLPPEVGPHDFQFRPKDLKRLDSAELILLNGLGLEDWLARTLQSSPSRRAIPRVAVSDGWPAEALIQESPTPGSASGQAANSAPQRAATGIASNPHLWLDPVFARHAVTNILKALESADPAHAAAYRSNAAAYQQRLATLDHEFREAMEQWRGRPVVTFHDAFPYFCRRYSLNLVGVVEEIPGNGPTPRHLASLIQLIRERHVQVIFTETQFNPRLARQLASDLSISIAELDVLETGVLSPDAYEDGQRRNLATFRKALR